MRELYTSPVAELVKFDVKDVITTSSELGDMGDVQEVNKLNATNWSNNFY